MWRFGEQARASELSLGGPAAIPPYNHETALTSHSVNASGGRVSFALQWRGQCRDRCQEGRCSYAPER